MTQYKYTVMNFGQEVVSTNNLTFARLGVLELLGRAYVQYNMDLEWKESDLIPGADAVVRGYKNDDYI